METHRLILPGHLNHYGFLFGGQLLAWIDEACWIGASLDYPQCRFVTVGMDDVQFHHSVREGTILAFVANGTGGHHFGDLSGDGARLPARRVPSIFATRVSLVNVDEDGQEAAGARGGRVNDGNLDVVLPLERSEDPQAWREAAARQLGVEASRVSGVIAAQAFDRCAPPAGEGAVAAGSGDRRRRAAATSAALVRRRRCRAVRARW